jgi:hypothetical protein
MNDELEPVQNEERLSMEEIEAQDAVSLPDKEVLSLLNVDANVDLGLDLAAPVDLAVAANLNVAAPIEAAAAANVLSPEAQALAVAQQTGTIDQSVSGSANADAPHATDGTAQPVAGTTEAGAITGAVDGVAGTVGETVDGTTGTVGETVDGTTGTVGETVDGTTGTVGDTVDTVGGTTGDVVGGTTDGVTGGVDSLLNGGSLLDANVDINADADVTAPIAGAVAANANVAAPIDAAVAANIGSEGAVAQAAAVQDVDIQQSLEDVEANATAEQNAEIQQ